MWGRNLDWKSHGVWNGEWSWEKETKWVRTEKSNCWQEGRPKAVASSKQKLFLCCQWSRPVGQRIFLHLRSEIASLQRHWSRHWQEALLNFTQSSSFSGAVLLWCSETCTAKSPYLQVREDELGVPPCNVLHKLNFSYSNHHLPLFLISFIFLHFCHKNCMKAEICHRQGFFFPCGYILVSSLLAYLSLFCDVAICYKENCISSFFSCLNYSRPVLFITHTLVWFQCLTSSWNHSSLQFCHQWRRYTLKTRTHCTATQGSQCCWHKELV